MAKDGGPAFPHPMIQKWPEGGNLLGGADGMTLRQWYAGQALAGLLAAPSDSISQDVGPDARDNPHKAATWCVEFADAMLDALERKEAI